MSLQTQSQVAN